MPGHFFMNLRLKEFLFFTFAALVLLALSSLPTWAGYASQDADRSFIGIFDDHPDFSLHIAMMQTGIQGDWSYQIRFTTEEQKPVVMKMFYVALGHVSRLLNLPPETTYHLFRWIFGYTALLSIFLLCRHVLEKRMLYWSAFFLAALGSGVGWIQMLAGPVTVQTAPIDFGLIDAYVFYSIAVFPHFAFQLTLITLSLLFYLQFLESHQWGWIAAIVFACFLVQLVNPVSLFVMDVALFIITLVWSLRDKQIYASHWLALLVTALAQVPLLAYNLVILTRDPVWSQFSTQNVTLSPDPLYTLMGFGLFWPFALVGVINAIRRRDAALLGLAGWAIAAFLFAYLPFNIQRRFLLGVTIPLAVLAVCGLQAAVNALLEKRESLRSHLGSFYLAYVLLASISTLYLALGGALYMKTRPESFFYPASLNPVFTFLKENGNVDDVILGNIQTSLLAAQKTGLKVYSGHSMETLHYEQKTQDVIQAYKTNYSGSNVSALPVNWVIYGPYEQAVAPNFNPGQNLEEVYQNEDVTLYRVVK